MIQSLPHKQCITGILYNWWLFFTTVSYSFVFIINNGSTIVWLRWTNTIDFWNIMVIIRTQVAHHLCISLFFSIEFLTLENTLIKSKENKRKPFNFSNRLVYSQKLLNLGFVWIPLILLKIENTVTK